MPAASPIAAVDVVLFGVSPENPRVFAGVLNDLPTPLPPFRGVLSGVEGPVVAMVQWSTHR